MPFIGKQPEVGAYQLIDSITTSATATYALTVDGSAYFPASARNLIVSLNGVTQAPESAYTVSGSDIVFASALTASDVIDYILVIGDAVDIGTPSDGTVGTSQLASSIDLSGKTLTFANDQISGDAIDGGTATLDGLTVDTDTLVVDSTNNRVGIGGSPSCPLHVKKDGYLKVIVQDASGTNTPLSIGSGNNGVTLSNNASADTADEAITLNQISQSAIFFTAGSERMRLDSSGNLLVGQTASGASRVEIKGASNTSSDYSLFCRNSDSTLSFYVRNDGIINVGQDGNSPYNYSVSGRDLYVDSAGTMGYLSSTRESKANIESLSDISWLYNLSPVSFNYREKDEETSSYTDQVVQETEYGFIADEVEQVHPNLCFYDVDEEGNQTLAGVTYRKLIPALTKAIQEQQAMIETLQAQVAELQGAN